MTTKCVGARWRFLAGMLFCAAIWFAPHPLLAQEANAGGRETGFEIQFVIGEWPPMVTETMPGFGKHSERVRQIFAEMGYRVKFVFLSWQRAFELTRRGDYVATFSWLSSKDRMAQFHIPTQPIAHSKQVGFYKKSRFPDGLEVNGFDDLLTFGIRPIGVSSYWYEEEFAKRNIDAEIAANIESAWRFLDAERADILFEEEEVGWLDMANFLGESVVDAFDTTEPLTTDDMFILFSRNHPHGERLSQEFDAFMLTDRGQEFCQKWAICVRDAGYVPTPDLKDVPKMQTPSADAATSQGAQGIN